MKSFAKYFDHTILKPEATETDVLKICSEAKEYGFASVCVNECYTELVSRALEGTDVETCVVVGFPLGASSSNAKAAETRCAVEKGADEIDMVINVGALKDKKYDVVEADIKAVRQACEGKTLKVIIETCLLTDDEKIKACELSVSAGADFVKTSTGFSTGGATVSDVALMRKTVGDKVGVKASGGIRDYSTAVAMIEAGANRLGTSATVKIVNDKVN
ncbi:MAG: deoxyribose-phosphate aldolase [Lachnospira sp.]|nr:deoxyribose-phosphate aldolase [Lachnospira sp.]